MMIGILACCAVYMIISSNSEETVHTTIGARSLAEHSANTPGKAEAGSQAAKTGGSASQQSLTKKAAAMHQAASEMAGNKVYGGLHKIGPIKNSAPPTGNRFPKLAEEFSKGVVQVMVVKAHHQWLNPQKPPITEEVSGSGFFVHNKHLGKLKNSKELHVVTNAHVAMDALKLYIRVPATGQFPIPATVVGLSPPQDHDIALLRVDTAQLAKGLKQSQNRKLTIETAISLLSIGNSDQVKSGEKLMALGYPEGMPGVKSTLGVMSGYQEMGNKLYLQMTSPINPGNSGGPLLDRTGRVVGMNTAGIERSQSIGFSIPSAVIDVVLPVLTKVHIFEKPVFGFELNPLTEESAQLFGMPQSMGGVYVAKVFKKSIASKAGLRQGDILIEVAGHQMSIGGQIFVRAIKTYASLAGFLSRIPLNTKAKCKVFRKGKVVSISMPYKMSKPKAIPLVHEAALNSQVSKDFQIIGGLVVSPLTQNFVRIMTTGVAIKKECIFPGPHSIAKYGRYPKVQQSARLVIAGVATSSLAESTKIFKAGHVIHKINHKKVRTTNELCMALSHPVKDPKGMLWVTVEVEGGIFGAMPWKSAKRSDSKLAKMGLFQPTSCGGKKKNKTTKKQKDQPKKSRVAPDSGRMPPVSRMPPGSRGSTGTAAGGKKHNI
jgi:serine protease Do